MIYQCPNCGKNFFSESGLNGHLAHCKSNNGVNGKDSSFNGFGSNLESFKVLFGALERMGKKVEVFGGDLEIKITIPAIEILKALSQNQTKNQTETHQQPQQLQGYHADNESIGDGSIFGRIIQFCSFFAGLYLLDKYSEKGGVGKLFGIGLVLFGIFGRDFLGFFGRWKDEFAKTMIREGVKEGVRKVIR